MRKYILPTILAMLLLTATLALTPPARCQGADVYLLADPEGAASDVDVAALASKIGELLENMGFTVKTITVEDFGVLLKSPPDDIVIVNCHGGVIPIPAGYGGDVDKFLSDLVVAISKHRWVFINVAGAAFSRASNIAAGVDKDAGGVSAFLAKVGASCERGSGTAHLTPMGERLACVLDGRLEVPASVEVTEAISTDAAIVFAIYEVDGKYACVGVRVGDGVFVDCGLTGDLDTMAKAAVATIGWAATIRLPPGFKAYDITIAKLEQEVASIKRTRNILLALVAIAAALLAYLIVKSR